MSSCVEPLLFGGGHQRAADPHHRVAADLQVQVGGAAFDGNLQEVVDVHRLPVIGTCYPRVVAGCPGVDRLQPAVGVRRLALDDLEEPLLDRLGDRPAAAAADLDPVHRLDRRHLDGRADEEHLVGDVQHFARQRLLAHLEAEVARDRHHRVARDARQDRVADRRRVDDAVADDEDVLAAAFAQVALRVERDAFGVALGDRLHLDQLRVGVVGHALRHRRRRVRRVAGPGGDLDVDAFLDRFLGEVGAPFPQHDRHVHRAGKRVDAERVVAAIDRAGGCSRP